MKLKQLVLANSLFFSCQISIGATLNLPDDQKFNNLPKPSRVSKPINNPYDTIFDIGISDTQLKSNQLRRDYTETLVLLKNRQFKAAETRINSLIKKNPNIPAFYNLQGLLESIRKEPILAISSFNKSIDLDPKNQKAHLGIALVYLNTGKLVQAKKYAQSTLAINDKSIHAYIILTKIAYQDNKLHDVEKILLTAKNKVLGDSKLEIMVADRLAKLYMIQNQPQKTIKLAQDIIKRYPNDSSALSLLATAQIYNNRTTQAIETIEKIINLEEDNTRARLLLVQILLTQPGNELKTIKLLDEVNIIAPYDRTIQVQKTVFLIKLNHFSEALNSAGKIKLLEPNDGLAEILEGEIYLAEKKLELALPAFQKSYQIKPSIQALNAIINIMLAQDQQTEALHFLRKELEKDPKNLIAHFRLGNIYLHKNMINVAEQHYQAILAIHTDNAIVLNNLAWIYYQRKDSEALEYAKKAYQISPETAAIADSYAVILVNQGDLKNGLSISKKASKLAPLNNDIQYHLANAYVLNGEPKQAIKILQPLVSSKKNFSEKEAATNLLKKLE